MALAQNPSIAALSNLVLYYDAANVKSFPGAGTTWNDMSGNNNNGTMTNGPLWSAANNGLISFDGTNDYVVASNSSTLNNNIGTVEFMIYINSFSNADWIVYGIGSGAYAQWYVRYFSSSLDFSVAGIGKTASYSFTGAALSTYFPTGSWRHVVMSYDCVAGSGSIYVNGSLAATMTITTNTNASWTPASLYVGGYSWDGYSNTRFAFVKIYNTALTASQVLQNFNASRGRFFGNIPFSPTDISGIALWLDADDPRTLFSNTSGTTRATADATAVALWADKSGNGRNASQSTANKCPLLKTSVLNNRNVIRGDGSNDTLSLSRCVSEDFSIFIVFQTTQSYFRFAASQWYEGAGLFDSEVGGVTNDYGISMYQGYPRAGTGNPDTSITDPSTRNNGSATIVCFTRLKSTGALNLYTNGIPVASGTGTTASLTSPTVNYLMSTADSFGYMSGDMAEVIAYSSVLSSTNRIKVEQYLQNKWGISSGFLPTQISGIQLWLDSSDSGTLFQDTSGTIPVVNDGDPVGLWRDKSGNAKHATQSTNANRPLFKTSVQNSKNVLRFDGSNDGMAGSDTGFSTTTSTVFVICKSAIAGTDNYPFMFGTDAATQLVGLTTYNNQMQITQYGASTFVAFTTNAWNVIYFTKSSNNWTMNLNGTSASTTMTTSTVLSGNYGIGFNRSGNRAFFNGDIAEVILYNSVLSTSQIQQVQAYLNQKWGIF